MARERWTADHALAVLAETPARIRKATDGLPQDLLRRAPEADAWSANEVLSHLRACADVRGGAILTILSEDSPTIRAVNPRRWDRQAGYRDLEFDESVRAFADQRAALLQALEALPAEGWAREATITGAGKPYRKDVLGFACWLAQHERSHLRQIEQIAGALRGSERD